MTNAAAMETRNAIASPSRFPLIGDLHATLIARNRYRAAVAPTAGAVDDTDGSD
ncbi:hypothetical protein [Mycobacterium sp. E735]|uniref:hypothetical protein n=1 Tax=Mycobacterium sp. E735 TaxID=1834148 RepID=UPI0018D3C543|nr:hypothetical protein [Mycobacterium sp. E735]